MNYSPGLDPNETEELRRFAEARKGRKNTSPAKPEDSPVRAAISYIVCVACGFVIRTWLGKRETLIWWAPGYRSYVVTALTGKLPKE